MGNDKDALRKDSEEYALYCEEQEDGWHRCYDDIETDFEKKVNSAIAEGDEEGFCKLFENEEYHFMFSRRPFYSCGRLVYVIYTIEKKRSVDWHILKMGRELDEIINRVIDRIRFYLWRIEFAKDEEASSQLIKYIIENRISVYALPVIVDTSNLDKKKHIYYGRK